MNLATIVREEPLLTVLRAHHFSCLSQSAEFVRPDIIPTALQTTTHVSVHINIYYHSVFNLNFFFSSKPVIVLARLVLQEPMPIVPVAL